jgi:MFS family permease
VSALRHVPFALVWSGALISNVGTLMEGTTQAWLVYEQSHDTRLSGLLTFVTTFFAAPLVLFMGLVADRVDRRRLLLVFQILMMLIAGVQAFAAHRGWVEPWMVITIALFGGVAAGAAGPAWHSLVPDLVPREDLGSAIGLNSAQYNTARVIGPMLAGWVIAHWGFAFAFDLNVVSFGLVILALIGRAKPRESAERPGPWREELGTALRMARQHRGIATLIATGAAFIVFAGPILALLPALADGIRPGEVTAYSHLLAAFGMGAVLGVIVLPHLALTKQRTIAIFALLVGASLVALAASRELLLSQAILFVFGFGWCILLTMQNTALQMLVPDAMRGRIMSVNVLAFFIFQPGGQLGFGYLASRIPLTTTLVIMGAGAALVGLWHLVFRVPEIESVPFVTEMKGEIPTFGGLPTAVRRSPEES